MRLLAVLAAVAALPALAQQGEIFIPGATEAPVIEARPSDPLAACLANPSEATCTGVNTAPGGRSFESDTGAPGITFETLILDLGGSTVTASNAAPATPPDYTAPVAPAKPIALPAVAITIEFDFDSARLRYDQAPKIDALVRAFQAPELQGYSFMVIGHTDASGSNAYNCDLSRRRAEEVTNVLRANYVTLGLVPVGFGEEVLKNVYDPNAAENRRVTFLRLPGDAQGVIETALAVCRGYY